jgi:hypothetical protein
MKDAKLPYFPPEDVPRLLREAADTIERGEPLRFPDAKVNYLQGPVIVAILRGLADGRTLRQILHHRRPTGRSKLEVFLTVNRVRCTRDAAGKLPTMDEACAMVAEQWHAEDLRKGRKKGAKKLSGKARRRAAEAVRKRYQRAASAIERPNRPPPLGGQIDLAELERAELEQGQKPRGL